MKAIVQVVFLLEVDTDDQSDYDIDETRPSRVAEEMAKFDMEHFPETLDFNNVTEITFKGWVK